MTRILVVDDEEDVRISLRVALEGAGYDIMEAENGLKADKILAENSFDLIITDIIMPDKEGFELIRDIKRNFSELKIIAITGGGIKKGVHGNNILDKDGILQNASMFGADDVLQKPFNRAELLKSVEVCLSDNT